MSSHTDPVATLQWLVRCDIGACDSTGASDVTRKIAAVRGWLDSLEADLACHMRSMFERGESLPAAELFTRDANISKAEADKRERRAEAITCAPAFGDALSHGDINAEHTDALANATANVDDQVRAEFFDRQHELLDKAKSMTPRDFSRHCRDEIRRLETDHGIERFERQRRDTSLRTSICSRTGMYKLAGEFDPETGHQLFTAIDAQLAHRLNDESNTDTNRQRQAAHALLDLVKAGKGEIRPTAVEATVIIDWATLHTGTLDTGSTCELGDGSPLPVETVRRLLCDAEIFPAVLGGNGVVLDLGRSRRVANRNQRRALRAMYDSCAFDGCGRSFDRCEIHHILEWDQHHGPTDLQNLVPVCSYHHHLVHEGGLRLELDEDRTLTVTRPDGEIHMRCELPHRRRTGDQSRLALTA